MRGRLAGAVVLCLALGSASGSAQVAAESCFGAAATIVGTPGDDQIIGTPGPDVIVTLDGNDSVIAQGGDDRICLGSGDDILLAGDGNDSIDGGADTDTDLYFTATGPVQVDLESGVATGDGRDTLRGIENVGGSNFNDTLKGDANMNVLTGEGGNDVIDGGSASDALDGGGGNDRLIGHLGDGDAAAYFDAPRGVTVDLAAGSGSGDGADTMTNVDSIIGSLYADNLAGDAALNFIVGAGGNDQLDGRGGFDIADFIDPVSANLATGLARGNGVTTMHNLEGLGGFNSADHLVGDAKQNFLEGFGGNDVLEGGGGPDLVFGDQGDDQIGGGAGDDKLFGGAGNDVLDGGAGPADVVSYINSPSAVRADLASKSATGEGTDTLNGVESLSGSTFDDTLVGDAKPNELFGNDGGDTLSGGAGADFVGGGGGKDAVQAGSGKDYCLDDQPTRGCEITGAPSIPGAPPRPPAPARLPAVLQTADATVPPRSRNVLALMARTIGAMHSAEASFARASVGRPWSVPAIPRLPAVRATPAVSATADYEYSAEPVCIAAKNGGTTEIAPPNVVHPVGNDDHPEEAWWQGTLYRQTGKSGPFRKLQAKTGWARAQLAGNVVLPGGVVVWKDASGRRAFRSPVPFKVAHGRYVWKGQIYWVRSGGRIFAPVEPHIIRARTITHNKNCNFG